jgi:hypothetical protein
MGSFDTLLGLLSEVKDPRRAEGKLYLIPVDTVFGVQPKKPVSIWRSMPACSLQSRTRRAIARGPAALLDLRCARRLTGDRSGRRNDSPQSNNGMGNLPRLRLA